MRTNYSGFALAVSMGLVVLLIGFLAMSAGGLVQFGPQIGALAEQADSSATVPQQFGEYGPGPRSTTTLPTNDVAATFKTVLPPDAGTIAAGDALFKNNCAQCHAVNEKVVGPALAGITMRRHVPWVVAWVHNSAKVIASGDEYAVKLYEDNGKQQMPAFPSLTDKDIKAILTWVESQQGQESATVDGPTLATR